MYWAAVTAAMANTMEKAWFQSERIAKQSARSFIQMPHEQSWTDRQSRCNWDALPAASREYFSK
jgi:hypothetical protein